MKMPLRWARGSIRHPRRTLLWTCLAVLAAAPGLLRLELRTDGHALVPPDDPAVLIDAEVRQHFQLSDPIVVLVRSRHPEGIYNLATLELVRRLTEVLGNLEGVDPAQIQSLATENRDLVYPGTLRFRPFLDPMPTTEELMARLRGDVDAASILTGTLVTADRRGTTVLVGVPTGPGAPDRTALYHRVRSAAHTLATSDNRILVVGAPVAEALLGTHIINDLTLLLPLALAVVALVIYLGCRRLWGVALAFAEVGACLVWTFGLMGWLGQPIYLTTAVLPVVLTTLGLTDEIHLFWCYQRLLATADPAPKALAATMETMVRPVVLTSLTTGLAFLSFLASPIPPVRSFGLFAAVGILFCMVFSLTAIPAALALLPASSLRRPHRKPSADRLAAWLQPLLRHRRWTLGGFAVLTVLAIWGMRGLRVQDSWIDGFAPESPFRQASDEVNEALLGTHLLLAHLEAEDKDGLLLPEILDAIGEFETFLRHRPEVGGALGTWSHLSTVYYLWQARREERRALPTDPRQLRRLLQRFDMGRGVHRRREVIDDARRRTVVTVFLKDANYRDTAALTDAIEHYAEDHLAPLGVRLSFAGDVAVSQAMIPAIVRTQVLSLSLAIGGALLGLWMLYRSLRWALYAVLPTAVAVLWVFGAMGWFGIPLGVATSMFCAVTLGIGVDYAIHFVERVRSADNAADPPRAVRQALAEAGPAIVADTVAIAAGFGLLTASQVPANARLGLLVALALAASCLLTLGGLSTVLTGRRP